jgi:hypothetical protein
MAGPDRHGFLLDRTGGVRILSSRDADQREDVPHHAAGSAAVIERGRTTRAGHPCVEVPHEKEESYGYAHDARQCRRAFLAKTE